MSFLEHLAENGIIKEEQISSISRMAQERFEGNTDAALVEAGLSPGDLVRLKSDYYGIPFKKVDKKTISTDLLKYVPEDSAKHYHMVPIGFIDGVLEVGMLDPDNIQAADALQFISVRENVPYKVFLISADDYELVMNSYQGITSEVDQALSELDTEIAAAATAVEIEENKKSGKKANEEDKIVEDAPIIKIVAVIINHATEGNASDIHIENTGEQVKVRFRVDGVLHTSLVLPLNVYSGIVARIKILAKLQIDQKRKPQDGGFSAKVSGRKIDFRVSTLPTYYGEKVVMRILDSEKGVLPLDKLELSETNLKMIRDALKRPYGLILITGPTGSGKTTTLYSMMNELDREKANVVSLEDPVEYHMPEVNQSQVMPEIGYTFASGLRSVLRQDPNIIMVGEIRDKETAELAIQAALTGHLVLSTLHTNNALGVVPRLVDMGVDPYLIAPTLILSIAQRLTRVICPSAKKEMPIDDALKQMLDRQFADLPAEYKANINMSAPLYESQPTSDCPSGTRGRVAIFEMFAVDKEMQAIILKSPNEIDIYTAARKKGMMMMREDAILKSMKGIVPLQEVYNFNIESLG
ncbi:MAG: type II/IV secretion system protein [Candidatus Pacebacteria bacterium]|nr:type II/IV secretion system protein [Candidatus Paceibacterota bacterium]